MTCECCDRPARKMDRNGIPLCDECYAVMGQMTQEIEHPEDDWLEQHRGSWRAREERC